MYESQIESVLARRMLLAVREHIVTAYESEEGGSRMTKKTRMTAKEKF